MWNLYFSFNFNDFIYYFKVVIVYRRENEIQTENENEDEFYSRGLCVCVLCGQWVLWVTSYFKTNLIQEYVKHFFH